MFHWTLMSGRQLSNMPSHVYLNKKTLLYHIFKLIHQTQTTNQVNWKKKNELNEPTPLNFQIGISVEYSNCKLQTQIRIIQTTNQVTMSRGLSPLFKSKLVSPIGLSRVWVWVNWVPLGLNQVPLPLSKSNSKSKLIESLYKGLLCKVYGS